MKMRTLLVMSVAGLCACAAMAGDASDQDKGKKGEGSSYCKRSRKPNPERMKKMLVEKLGITDEQATQVMDLMKKSREDMKKQRKELMEAMKKQREQFKTDLSKILNEEQMKKFEDSMRRRPRGGRRGRGGNDDRRPPQDQDEQ